MRGWPSVLVLWALLAIGCAETRRCPDASVFAEDGRCVPIPDAGPPPDGEP